MKTLSDKSQVFVMEDRYKENPFTHLLNSFYPFRGHEGAGAYPGYDGAAQWHSG